MCLLKQRNVPFMLTFVSRFLLFFCVCSNWRRAASTSAFSISFTNEIYSEQMIANEVDNIPLALRIYSTATMTF